MSSSWANEMVKGMRKDRPTPEAAYYIGTIEQLSPLTISLLGGAIMASGQLLRLTETMESKRPDLKTGQKVLVIGRGIYCAIDRI